MPSDLDTTMCRLAERRAAILLRNGRTCRLVAWRPAGRRQNRDGTRRRGRGNTMRVEFPGGGRATISIRELARILDEGKGADDRPDLLHA